MTTEQNPPSDGATPVCRKCRQSIRPGSEDAFLDKFGGFVRLRCTTDDCDHEDWYKEPVLKPAPPEAAQPEPEGPGEVWIHDVMLGLSFKADRP